MYQLMVGEVILVYQLNTVYVFPKIIEHLLYVVVNLSMIYNVFLSIKSF